MGLYIQGLSGVAFLTGCSRMAPKMLRLLTKTKRRGVIPVSRSASMRWRVPSVFVWKKSSSRRHLVAPAAWQT